MHAQCDIACLCFTCKQSGLQLTMHSDQPISLKLLAYAACEQTEHLSSLQILSVVLQLAQLAPSTL